MHVTLRVKNGIPSLRRQLLGSIVRKALRMQRQKLTDEGAEHFQVVHFSIQDDHIHLLVEAPDKRGIWRGVVGLEVRITRRLNKVLGRKGRLWADRYHRHDLRSPRETRNALRYVLLNLHKHYRVFALDAFADPMSSAGTFDGFTRPVELLDAVPWDRVTPRTWLLGTGWQRRGLIDPQDAPQRAA